MASVKKAEWGAFYKYGTFSKMERIKRMICDSEFYFASPEQLNDPSDCRNKMADHSDKELEQFLIAENMKHCGDQRKRLFIKKGIKEFGTRALLDEITHEFNKTMDVKYGVFSLAKRPDNMALWAKYAGDHMGYCLEFSDLSKFCNVFEVTYAEKMAFNLSPEEDQSSADFLYTKSPEWSNEEEARMISRSCGYQILPKGSLKSVILGEGCDVEKEEAVIDWAKKCGEGINIKKARFNKARQELEFQTIVTIESV